MRSFIDKKFPPYILQQYVMPLNPERFQIMVPSILIKPNPLATLIYRWFTLTLYLGPGRYKILCAKFRLQALSRSQ